MTTQNSTTPTDLQTAAGGEIVDCIYDGREVAIFVRQVTPGQLLDYLRAEAIGEEKVLRMVCALKDFPDPIDLDKLSLDAYEALIEADARQNFTHARRREAREAARARRTMEGLAASNPELHARLTAEQGKALESMLSLLKPSPEAAAAGESVPTTPPSPS